MWGGVGYSRMQQALENLRADTDFTGISDALGLIRGVEITIDVLTLSAGGKIAIANPLAVALRCVACVLR
jgi:hypothetical protein